MFDRPFNPRFQSALCCRALKGLIALRMKLNTTNRSFVRLCVTLFTPALATLPACNTVEGVGEDVEAAGEAIDEASEEAQNDDD